MSASCATCPSSASRTIRSSFRSADPETLERGLAYTVEPRVAYAAAIAHDDASRESTPPIPVYGLLERGAPCGCRGLNPVARGAPVHETYAIPLHLHVSRCTRFPLARAAERETGRRLEGERIGKRIRQTRREQVFQARVRHHQELGDRGRQARRLRS